MTRLVILVLVVLTGLSMPSRAETAQDYKAVARSLEAQKKQQAELERKAAEIEGQISGNKDKLVDVGRSIQFNEKNLREIEEKIAGLKKRKEDISETLQTDRLEIARLLAALRKISLVPPDAIVALPASPLETAQSAMLMQKSVPVLYRHAASLRARMTELERVTVDLEEKKKNALAASRALEKDQREISELIIKRERLYAQTNTDLKKQQENVKQISLKAQSLQDLVRRLNDDEEKNKAGRGDPPEAFVPVPNVGQAQLPVSGIVTVRYGEPDSFGAPSKGVSIEGRDKALVVAPMGGVVRFAGPFKNYGQLIILEHKKGYHSLIAGLQKIDTVVGQNINAGEPLGFLGTTSNGIKPSLYYELRLNGAPINPARVFNDQG